MKIISLKAENFKRIQAVFVKPAPTGITIIAGDNEAGKSSAMDAITAAISGKKFTPDKPVRKGHEKSIVICELDDMTIRRSFTANGGGGIKITPKKGATLEELPPQGLLDKLWSSLSHDPLSFLKLKKLDQRNELLKLAGITVDDIDEKYDSIHKERTEVNKLVKQTKALLKTLPFVEGIPEQEENLDELLKQKVLAHSEEMEFNDLSSKYEDKKTEFKEINIKIEALRKKATEIKTEATGIKENIDSFTRSFDIEALGEKISSIGHTNEQVRENQKHLDGKTELESLESNLKGLESKLEKLKSEKSKRLEDADFPVAGIEVTSDEVLFKGVPLDQASQAEKIRVSVALRIAANDTLKLILIRDAALLDHKSMEIIARIADENDMQVIMERITTGDDHPTVIIEDGMVSE